MKKYNPDEKVTIELYQTLKKSDNVHSPTKDIWQFKSLEKAKEDWNRKNVTL